MKRLQLLYFYILLCLYPEIENKNVMLKCIFSFDKGGKYYQHLSVIVDDVLLLTVHYKLMTAKLKILIKKAFLFIGRFLVDWKKMTQLGVNPNHFLFSPFG